MTPSNATTGASTVLRENVIDSTAHMRLKARSVQNDDRRLLQNPLQKVLQNSSKLAQQSHILYVQNKVELHYINLQPDPFKIKLFKRQYRFVRSDSEIVIYLHFSSSLHCAVVSTWSVKTLFKTTTTHKLDLVSAALLQACVRLVLSPQKLTSTEMQVCNRR